MKFQANIIDYLGKYEDGVIVLISISYNSIYYDCTFFYNEKNLLLTIPEEFESSLGTEITLDEDYVDLIRYIIKRIVPYEEIFYRLDFVIL